MSAFPIALGVVLIVATIAIGVAMGWVLYRVARHSGRVG